MGAGAPPPPGWELVLRPLAPADADALRRIHATPEVVRWWDVPAPGFPLTDDPESTRWTIEVDGAVAGLIQAYEELEPKYRHANIDVFLDPALHGRGIGTEAVRRIVRHLVDVRGHHRLTIDPAAGNAVAIRTYAKVGFRPVGVLRRYERDVGGDGWHDGLLMELLAEELEVSATSSSGEPLASRPMLRRTSATPAASRPAAGPARSRRFRDEGHGRFWWHHLEGTDYVPSIYHVLTDDEWQLMEDWYAATQAADSIGEINVPAMSMLQGLISGGGLQRVVQLGGYYGYSALLMGFWLRHMGQGGRLISIDIDPAASNFSKEWIGKAGLEDTVLLMLSDSAAEQALTDTIATFESRMPQLILLDSSHQYQHTLRELDLWVPAMDPQTIMLLHDTSTYARSWDQQGHGGVQKALDDWLPGRTDVAYLNLNRRVGEEGVSDELTYRDGCGLGLLQKL